MAKENHEELNLRLEKRIVLAVACLGSFLTPFMGSAINVALPAIGKEFNAAAVVLGWVATAYLLAAAVFLLPIGKLSDIWGRKRVFLIGLLIFSFASVLCALSPSISALILFRIIQAVGSAMIFSTAVAIVTSVFPIGERGWAMGITVASVYIGLSLGPFAGGFLTGLLGWRSIFLFTVPLGLAAFILVFKNIRREWADARGEAFDAAGSVLYGISLTLLMIGFSRLPSAMGILLTIASAVMFALFVRYESSIDFPVMDIRIFKANRVFTFSNMAALVHYSATFGVSFLLSLYLQYIKGLTPQQTGVILVAQPVMMALFSPMMGRLSDKIQPRIVASTGMGMTTISLFIFFFLGSTTSIPVITANLLFLGLGYSLFSSPNTNAVMSSVEKKLLGVASATLGTMRLVGQVFSMGIAMMLFALFLGGQKINPTNHDLFIQSTRFAFLIFAILCTVGIFFSLARGSMRR